jgi:hypothetical protein
LQAKTGRPAEFTLRGQIDRDEPGGSSVEMAVIVHHSGGRDGDESRGVTVVKAIITVLLVAAALGLATWVASRALVRLMS